MSAFPTGNELADMNILLTLSDRDLARVCRSDSYLNQLCQNDLLWRWKLEQRYPQYLPLRANFPSYREIYRFTSCVAYAVIIGSGQIQLYNNIRTAYQEFIKWLGLFSQNPQLLPIERVNELPLLLRASRFPLKLYGLALGEITPDKPLITLINVSTPQIIIDSNLVNMPVLQPEVLVTYTLNNSSLIGLNRPTEEILEYLDQASQDNRLDEEMFSIQRTDNQGTLTFVSLIPGVFFTHTRQLPVVIGKVNHRFMLMVLPQQYLQQLQFQAGVNDQGRPIVVPTFRSIKTLLQQVYDQLPWEPLANLINYL